MITLRGQFFILPLISFISGIIIQTYFQLPLLSLILLSSMAAVILSVLWHQKTITNKLLIISPLLFATGALQLTLQQELFRYATDHYVGKTITLTALVTDKEVCPQKWQQMLTLTIPYTFQFPWLGAFATIRCVLPRRCNIDVGDIITLPDITIPTTTGERSLSKNNSFYDYLIKEGVTAYLFLSSDIVYTIERPAWSLLSLLWEKKQALYHAMASKLSTTTQRFYDLIFLGNKTNNQLDELGNQCNTWGISHFLARSGLHIALLIIMWKWILSFIPFPLLIKHFILIVLALVYHLFSWQSISFLRAFMLFLLIHQGALLFQRVLVPHLFIIICFLVLFFNPYQLFFLDFQLSFFLTYVLITFCSSAKGKGTSHKKSAKN